jgi:hypothetical protein
MNAATATIATLYAVTRQDPDSTPANKAIAAALTAYHRAHELKIAEGEHPMRARLAAKTAYRLAMPIMDTKEGIRAYIACVAQGMNLEVFGGAEASQMLYAAQVALSLAKADNPKKEAK